MKVGIDFDEVVADSMTAIVRLHNEQYGTHLTRADFTSYIFENVWGGTREEAIKKVDAFFDRDQLKEINPMAGSIKGIRALKEQGHELCIITGRNERNMAQTERWIKHHFADVFKGVHYAHFFTLDKNAVTRKKLDICRELGIELLIDDNLATALECSEGGVKVFLFDQRWNISDALPEKVIRVYLWDEIVEKLSHMSLADEMRAVPIDSSVVTNEVAKQFFAKLDEGGYSRDEDPINHFGAYFALYNPATKKVFITHHKKSGLWLFPGGHVDRGETTIQTLKREMHEELGVVYNPPANQKPFLLTITRMDTPNYKCKTHYDVWYSVPTDGSDFKIDPSEFHDTKWLPVNEARELIVDEQNLQALNKIEKILNHDH